MGVAFNISQHFLFLSTMACGYKHRVENCWLRFFEAQNTNHLCKSSQEISKLKIYIPGQELIFPFDLKNVFFLADGM